VANDDTTDPFMQELIEAMLKPLDPSYTLRECKSLPSGDRRPVIMRMPVRQMLRENDYIQSELLKYHLRLRDAEDAALRDRLRQVGIDPDDRSDGWETRARVALRLVCPQCGAQLLPAYPESSDLRVCNDCDYNEADAL